MCDWITLHGNIPAQFLEREVVVIIKLPHVQSRQCNRRCIVSDTLEEWKLVFFGTETSVEIDDELDKDKPLPPAVHQDVSQSNAASDNVRHNAVDTEGDPWTGSQQVNRVSHPEVQKSTTENQTSGCAALENNGTRCLGGCLILLLLAYLIGMPDWELITSWPASTNNRSVVVVETTTSSWTNDAAINRLSEARECSWW